MNIELRSILGAICRHGQVVAAARELGCSQAYVHARLKKAGLTLGDVLAAESADELLKTEGGSR